MPSATTTALAATRRAGRGGSGTEFLTEIIVKGELGNQDANALAMLMEHVTSQIGIAVTASTDSQGLRPGEYYAFRARDPYAPAGRVRLLLRSREEVRRLYAGLHGQVLRVGGDSIRIAVQNDMVDSAGQAGNGRGARA